MELLRFENLSFTYPGGSSKALDDINFSLHSGEFMLLCGQSGCGKSTLLRLIKQEIAPYGEKSGSILYQGRPLESLSSGEAVSLVGFVGQNPEAQIVTDKVWHELSFGLENLGLPSSVIRRRCAETASFFGIQDWYRRPVDELSGGQKQLLCLAAVMAMQPRILLLDEPTSQLDPIAAVEFMEALRRLHRDLGLTVLLAEHRLEEVFSTADRVLVLEEGRQLLCDSPRAAARALTRPQTTGHGEPAGETSHPMSRALPAAARIYAGTNGAGECPLTVRQGREYLAEIWGAPSENPADTPAALPESGDNTQTPPGLPALRLKNIWFRYEKNSPDVLRGVDLSCCAGEVFCILGGNGTGKTTMLNILAGLARPYAGQAEILGRSITKYRGNELFRDCLAYVPQNPELVFSAPVLSEDFLESCKGSRQEREQKVRKAAERLGISHLMSRHPYDLSGGEQQKAAIAKLLLQNPKVLLLDEPTKGIDAFAKADLIRLLRELAAQRMTVILVTHDVEFAAEAADRCALFFDGELIGTAETAAFFAQNHYYTTAANRIARPWHPGAVTCDEVIALCRGQADGGEGA